MPYVIGRPSKFLALAATMAGLLVATQPAAAAQHHAAGAQHQDADGQHYDAVPRVAWQPASADATCPTVESSPLLSSFGDSYDYAPLTGGTFEGSIDGWALTNAAVVDGNESSNVVSASDSQSLSLSSGGSAISPSFCLDNRVPTFRFFALNTRRAKQARLSVRVHWTDAHGNTGSTAAYALYGRDYTEWALSPSFALVAGLKDGDTLSAQIVFSASHGSTWQIDDVLLDPYAK